MQILQSHQKDHPQMISICLQTNFSRNIVIYPSTIQLIKRRNKNHALLGWGFLYIHDTARSLSNLCISQQIQETRNCDSHLATHNHLNELWARSRYPILYLHFPLQNLRHQEHLAYCNMRYNNHPSSRWQTSDGMHLGCAWSTSQMRTGPLQRYWPRKSVAKASENPQHHSSYSNIKFNSQIPCFFSDLNPIKVRSQVQIYFHHQSSFGRNFTGPILFWDWTYHYKQVQLDFAWKAESKGQQVVILTL